MRSTIASALAAAALAASMEFTLSASVSGRLVSVFTVQRDALDRLGKAFDEDGVAGAAGVRKRRQGPLPKCRACAFVLSG